MVHVRFYHFFLFTCVAFLFNLFTFCKSSDLSSDFEIQDFSSIGSSRTSFSRPLFYWGNLAPLNSTDFPSEKLVDRPKNRKNRNKKLLNENSKNQKSKRRKNKNKKQKKNKSQNYMIQEKNFVKTDLQWNNQTDFKVFKNKKFRRKPKFRRFKLRKRPMALNLFEVQNGGNFKKGLTDNNVISKKCDCDQICDNMTRKCECYTGYILEKDGKTCRDVDECLESKICSHRCLNTIGSYHCLPYESNPNPKPKPKSKPSSKNTPYPLALMVPSPNSWHFEGVNCPPLFPPRIGSVECSLRTEFYKNPRSIQDKPRKNQVGSVCELSCPIGYKRDGKWKKICNMEGRWIGEDSGRCVHVLPRNFNPQDNYIDIKWEFSLPTIQCPSPIVTHLERHQEKILVQVPQPLSSVEQRHITSSPELTGGFLEVPVGQHWIRFKATHPISGQSAECSTYVAVKSP